VAAASARVRAGQASAIGVRRCAEPSSNLGITSVYLQGIDNAEIIDTVHASRAPMIPVSTPVRL
jgi:hypothetical protein